MKRDRFPWSRLGDLAATLEGENGFVTRLLVKSGNRELTGQDFRWLVEERILQQGTPPSMAVLEREEWGVFFGRLTGLKKPMAFARKVATPGGISSACSPIATNSEMKSMNCEKARQAA